MPNDPEFMRKKYSELALGLILIDVLEAEEQGVTVEELVARRVAEQLKPANQQPDTKITPYEDVHKPSQPTSSSQQPHQRC